MARHRGSVAPRLLDPILGLVERIDRSVRRIAPVEPGALIGLERHRHRGEPVTLRDGTRVDPGDQAWIVHFDNRRLRELAVTGWQSAGWREAQRGMRAIARRHAAMLPERRPVAYTGTTILWPLVVRGGFEARPRTPSAWVRLEDWYLRSVLVRWSRRGRGRLAHGHRPLRSRVVWLSGAELLRRYGSPPPPE